MKLLHWLRFSFANAAFFILFNACNRGRIWPGVNATVKDLRGLDACGFTLQLDKPGRDSILMLEPINLHDFITNPVDGQKVRNTYTVLRTVSSCMVRSVAEIKSLHSR